jgi:ASC-1-like (ASCH) protein
VDIRLNDKLFEKISTGSKTVEVFLNDEQMKHFGVGDTLAIHRESNDDDYILTSVWSIKKCRTIDEVYQKFPAAAIGLTSTELAQSYSTEAIKRHGLLAIKIRLLKSNFN